MRELSIDAAGPGTPLPKFWQALGCDHLYQDTRSGAAEHLFARIGETGAIRYLRNHHALSDEMADFAPVGEAETERIPMGGGIYHEDDAGRPVHDFSIMDQVYDRWVAAGIRPIVEMDRVPSLLRAPSGPVPVNDFAKWTGLISAFTEHLLARYGEDEVLSWYFECYNEPDLILYWGFAYEASRGTFLGNRSVLTAGPVLKPIWAVYEMLARLGDERLDLGGAGAGDRVAGLATRDACGSLRILLYHFAEGPEPAGAAEEVRVRLDGDGALRPDEASWYLLDREHGNTFRAWEAMGRPPRLAPEQLAELRSLERPRRHAGGIGVEAGGGRRRLTLRLPAQSVSLLEIPAAA